MFIGTATVFQKSETIRTEFKIMFPIHVIIITIFHSVTDLIIHVVILDKPVSMLNVYLQSSCRKTSTSGSY